MDIESGGIGGAIGAASAQSAQTTERRQLPNGASSQKRRSQSDAPARNAHARQRHSSRRCARASTPSRVTISHCRLSTQSAHSALPGLSSKCSRLSDSRRRLMQRSRLEPNHSQIAPGRYRLRPKNTAKTRSQLVQASNWPRLAPIQNRKRSPRCLTSNSTQREHGN